MRLRAEKKKSTHVLAFLCVVDTICGKSMTVTRSPSVDTRILNSL